MQLSQSNASFLSAFGPPRIIRWECRHTRSPPSYSRCCTCHKRSRSRTRSFANSRRHFRRCRARSRTSFHSWAASRPLHQARPMATLHTPCSKPTTSTARMAATISSSRPTQGMHFQARTKCDWFAARSTPISTT
ncbi:MAG: hypothetical protein ACK56F_02520, partial [bacterium]